MHTLFLVSVYRPSTSRSKSQEMLVKTQLVVLLAIYNIYCFIIMLSLNIKHLIINNAK